MAQKTSSNKSANYIAYILDTVNQKKDKGFRANLRCADNPDLESRSWPILANWIDLENSIERRAYAVIGSSLVKSKRDEDGNLGIGEALKNLAEKSDQEIEHSTEAMRLRRLLACKDSIELVEVFRPILSFLASKEIPLCHGALLDEIIRYRYEESREYIRTRWAQAFFSRKEVVE